MIAFFTIPGVRKKMYRLFSCYEMHSKRYKRSCYRIWLHFYHHPRHKIKKYSTIWTDRHCNFAIFLSFTHPFPTNYFAAVEDVVTNCLDTNCVSKQISAVSESFGKYREWQRWLSIWAQLFSSLVGTHKHMNTVTDAHTYSCQWFGRSERTFEFCTAYMLGDGIAEFKHGVERNLGLKIGHFIGCTAFELPYLLLHQWISRWDLL